MKKPQIKKALCTLIATVLTLTVFAGCKESKKATTVYYLNFKPEIAAVYDEIAAAYKKETGVTLKVTTAASGTYEQTLKSEMAKSTAPTIFQINGPRGYANWKDYCADLKHTEIYKKLSNKGLAIFDGTGVYGIPYVVEGYGIIYNEDIMNKYFSLNEKSVKINSAEEINDFETLKAVVEDMTRLKSKLGINGVFAATSLLKGEDWRWTTHLANVPLYYEFQKNNIDLSSDATKTVAFDFAENYKNIFDLYVHNSTTPAKLLGSKSVSDSMAEFALGKCAMVQNGNWAWSQINSVSGNTVKENKIKFLPIFTGTLTDKSQGLCVGTENFLCINKKASEEQQKAAADFIYWLFSSKTGKQFVTEKLNFIAPFDTFDSSEIPNDPLAKEVVKWMNKDELTTVPWNFTVFPNQTFKDNFGAALLSYAQDEKKWNEVKDLFVNEWKKESQSE